MVEGNVEPMGRPISMNRWILEKADHQIEAICDAINWLQRFELVPSTFATGETSKDLLLSDFYYVYYHSCLFIAYAAGHFPEDLVVKAQEAFKGGPEAMVAYAHSLRSVDREGWDLPNPIHHSAILAIQRPGDGEE